MKVLVTGGAGFIGSSVVRQLVARGDEVVVLDSLRPDVHAPGWRPPADVQFVQGDVRALAPSLLAGVDVVCHQAAKVGMGVDLADAPDYAGSNDLATAVLLAAMATAGVGRLVLASSMVVYGEGRYVCAEHGVVPPGPRLPASLAAGVFDPPCPVCGAALTTALVPEDAPLQPRSVYAATKLAQENLALAWTLVTGGSCVALRYHNVYGPGMPRDTPYAGVASIWRSATAAGRAPMVTEDGAQRRDFVHVDDVAAANVAALSLGAAETGAQAGRITAAPTARTTGAPAARTADPGAPAAGTAATGTPAGPDLPGFTPLNIGSGDPRPILDLAARLSELAGAPAPAVTGAWRAGDVRHITADSSAARALLGWTPAISFDDGVAEFATAPSRAPAAG